MHCIAVTKAEQGLPLEAALFVPEVNYADVVKHLCLTYPDSADSGSGTMMVL
jgi:hypothetical protein